MMSEKVGTPHQESNNVIKTFSAQMAFVGSIEFIRWSEQKGAWFVQFSTATPALNSDHFAASNWAFMRA